MIFENLAASNWQLAKAGAAYTVGSGFATLCRPDSKNEKTRLKLNPIGVPKNGEKGLRPLGHRSVEWHFDLCFQQRSYGGWGRG